MLCGEARSEAQYTGASETNSINLYHSRATVEAEYTQTTHSPLVSITLHRLPLSLSFQFNGKPTFFQSTASPISARLASVETQPKIDYFTYFVE